MGGRVRVTVRGQGADEECRQRGERQIRRSVYECTDRVEGFKKTVWKEFRNKNTKRQLGVPLPHVVVAEY